MTDEPSLPAGLGDDVTDDGVFTAVLEGYEAVYEALPTGPTFNRLWCQNAYRGEFPVEFAHIGFLTESEAQRLLPMLDVHRGDRLVDVACGAGGPGLWAARRSGASLTGVDPAPGGLAAARHRAESAGLAGQAEFRQGTFAHTGLTAGAADAVMTIEALQYAPDKKAALAEFARILKPGGRLAVVCFEVDPHKVAGLPVLGLDPVPDYEPILTEAGFTVEAYEETPGWAERVYRTFSAIVDAADQLRAEMGERAAAGVLAEAILTVAVQPYLRRVLVVAKSTGRSSGPRR